MPQLLAVVITVFSLVFTTQPFARPSAPSFSSLSPFSSPLLCAEDDKKGDDEKKKKDQEEEEPDCE
jgi:hypothetical protein